MRPLAPLLIVLATCTPRALPSTAVVVVPRTAPEAAPAPPPPNGCATLRAEAASSARNLFASARQRALADGQAELAAALETAPPDIVAKCWPAPRGAWITKLEGLKTEVGWGAELQMRWTLDFVDENGRRTSVVPSERAPLGADGYNLTVGGPDTYRIELTAFDFDGDGTPEIFVGFSGRYHEGEGFAVGRLYSAGHGAVEPYAPAAGLAVSGLRDADGDGRPDLVTSPFAAVGEGCGSGFGYLVPGPELIAHALPGGGFSQTDAVAAAAARAACPARPASLVVKGEESDTAAALTNVACARIRGAASAEVLRALDRECQPPPASDPCADHTCREGPLLRDAALRDPPIVLR